MIFPPPQPYTSPSSYRNGEPFKRKIEMHLSPGGAILPLGSPLQGMIG